jgi:hypothetical protein
MNGVGNAAGVVSADRAVNLTEILGLKRQKGKPAAFRMCPLL